MSKTIIVTGAASAYGRAIIHTLADEGHGVVAIMDPINDDNSSAARELQQTDNVELVEVDVKDNESVRSGLSFIINRYGHIDVLINNESTVTLNLAENTQADYLHQVFDTNVCGALRIFQAILPTMKKNKGGLLINVNSGINYLAVPFLTALIIAKAGLEILTESLLREVKSFGIESVSLWTGQYPVEFRLEEKLSQKSGTPHLHQEKVKLEADLAERNKNAKLQAQALAVHISELVNLPPGKRLSRYSLNPDMEKAEVGFASVRRLAAEVWQEAYDLTI
jgi:NAD(P)-dependent dehydrogenase (short-subunit alcohol dehydrogenase family)